MSEKTLNTKGEHHVSFNKAREVFKTHLLRYDPSVLATTKRGETYTYVWVDKDSKHYTIHRCKSIDRVFGIFDKVRDTGEANYLPKRFREFFKSKQSLELYYVHDPIQSMDRKIRFHLEQLWLL